jgi:hypothetical protein
LKPWLKDEWCIPSVGSEFVWRMEDVLDLYEEPYDPQFPTVCFDELPYQLTGEVRLPLPAEPGKPQRYDYEYHRRGTCNIFLHVEPQGGWRHVEVTERRTAQDFAHQMKALVDLHYPDAKKIRVVLDNLNTHTPAALYEAFPPEEARRILRRLEFHHTPKHGSWLNMAEIEFSVLSRQCLNRRLGDLETVRQEIAAWQAPRNQAGATINWRFTADKAREKLKRLYPS